MNELQLFYDALRDEGIEAASLMRLAGEPVVVNFLVRDEDDSIRAAIALCRSGIKPLSLEQEWTGDWCKVWKVDS